MGSGTIYGISLACYFKDFGFDSEMGSCWRVLCRGKRAFREYSG